MSTNEQSTPQRDFPRLFLFLGLGLCVMAGVVAAAFLAEDTIFPMLKGKPGGKTVLYTPRPVIVEPNPQPTASPEDVAKMIVPPPPDDPGLTVRNNLVLWLRADAIPENTKSEELVAIIPDGSKTRNDARQVYPIARPRYVKGVMNGKPAFHFNGKETFLYFEDRLGTISPATVYAVWARSNDCGKAFQRLYSSGAYDADYQNARKFPPNIPGANGIYCNAFEPTPDIIESVQNSKDKDGPDAPALKPQLHKNVSEAPVDLRRFFIGRLNFAPIQFFCGEVAEILVFNRALSKEEQAKVEEYLKTKYSL